MMIARTPTSHPAALLSADTPDVCNSTVGMRPSDMKPKKIVDKTRAHSRPAPFFQAIQSHRPQGTRPLMIANASRGAPGMGLNIPAVLMRLNATAPLTTVDTNESAAPAYMSATARRIAAGGSGWATGLAAYGEGTCGYCQFCGGNA